MYIPYSFSLRRTNHEEIVKKDILNQNYDDYYFFKLTFEENFENI